MLPLPQKGQAISYSDLTDIVQTINDISAKLSPKPNQSAFAGPNGDAATIEISNSLYSAKVSSPITNAKATVNSKQAFTISFGCTFKTPPVVTVTVQAGTGVNGDNGNTDASRGATAVITKVSTTEVTGYIVYNVAGKATNTLHMIAIGLSTNS